VRKILISVGITVAIVTGSTATAQAQECKHYKKDGTCDMSWTGTDMSVPATGLPR
jgi:hypothetical protein